MIIVENAEKAGIIYELLGFNVQPIGSHAGQGTSNRLIILDDTYIELMAVDYPTDANGIYSAFQATGGGLKSLAMRTSDAESVREYWSSQNVASKPAVHFRRPVDIDGETVTASFQIAFMDADKEPGVGIFVCEHETPQYVYRPEWSGHANTVRRIAGITIVADLPASYSDAADTAFGADCEHIHIEGGSRIRTGGSFIDYITPAAFASRYGDVPLPATKRGDLAASMTLEIESPASLIRSLETNAIPHVRQNDSIIVPAEAAANVVLVFIPAAAH